MSQRAASSRASDDGSDSGLIGRILGYIIVVFLSLFFLVGAGLCYWGYRLYFVEGTSWQGAVGPAGAGGVFLFLSLYWAYNLYRGSKREAERERLLEKHAGEPWKVRPAWRDGRVETSEQESSRFSSVLLAVFWNAVSWPLAYFAVFQWVEEAAFLWLILIFPLVGIGLVVHEIYRWMRRRKYGNTVLELETVPGVLGGRFTGVVRTGMKAENVPEEGFHVTLTCFRRRVRSGGDDEGRRVHLTPLWRDEKPLRGRPYTAEDGAQRMEVPVSFALPDDQPESTPVERENRHLWRLDVEAETPGIDYSEQLEVPVFDVEDGGGERAPSTASETTADRDLDLFWETDDEDGEAAKDEVASKESLPEEPPQEETGPYADREIEQTFTEPVSEGVEMRGGADGGMVLFFDKARHKGRIAVFFGAFLVFAGVTWLAFTNGKFQGGLFAAAATALLGYLVFWQATYTATLTVENGQIRVQRGPFTAYRYGSTKTFPASDLETAHVKVDGNSNYTLKLVRADTGRKVLVAQGLSNKQEADWLAAQVEEAAQQEARFAEAK